MLVAGPCALESWQQGFKIAEFVKSCGGTHFRGGIWKGQNRPIVNGKPEYLGIGDSGLEILSEIQSKLGLPCVCDAQSIEQVEKILISNIEYLMIGARNADNLCLLREVNKLYNRFKCNRKIILKRGPSQTIDELLGSAEHLGGVERVILCERGIVTFDRTLVTRWRLDLVGVAYIKKYTNYTIIVDPSHGSGDRQLVPLLCKAGHIADGLMVEVHYDPNTSPTDANQTVDFETFKEIAYDYRTRRTNQTVN